MGFFQYIKSRKFLNTVLIMLVITLALMFVSDIGLGFYTHHNQKITVPDLQKKSIMEAGDILEEMDLNYVVIDSSEFNPDFPPKSVMEQDPEAGSYVKVNRKIYLTLNPSNYLKVEVPRVLDQTKRQVVTRLKSSGFRIGKEIKIPDIGKDVVRRMEYQGRSIKPGDYLPKSSVIDLVLGDGLEEKLIDSLATDSIPDAGEF
jgi:beta-lactam-binding protein with PASTA domain